MVSLERLSANFAQMGTITAKGEGITRLAFSKEDWQARQFVITLMKNAGLAVRIDNFGNVIGRREGRDKTAPAVMFGSHIDSVPNGGNFDGVVGVLGAIEVINCMNDAGFKNEQPVELVVFMSEESSRFGVATLGSKAMCGHLSIKDLKTLVDKQGKSLYEALVLHGLDAENIAAAQYVAVPKAFLEIHIEQGKVLESMGKKIGIVTGIAAPTRLKVTLCGQADHSGATPMSMRYDALCAAAEIILQVEKLAKAETENPAVGTVGVIEASPGVMNVVPGRTELGIDIRSISAETKAKVVKALREKIAGIAASRGIAAEIATLTDEKPVKLKKSMTDFLDEVCRSSGHSYIHMPSGAGHDAMHWAERTHTGMLFIPCKGGISHNPAESAKMEDIAAAVEILYEAMRRLTSKAFVWKDA